MLIALDSLTSHTSVWIKPNVHGMLIVILECFTIRSNKWLILVIWKAVMKLFIIIRKTFNKYGIRCIIARYSYSYKNHTLDIMLYRVPIICGTWMDMTNLNHMVSLYMDVLMAKNYYYYYYYCARISKIIKHRYDYK